MSTMFDAEQICCHYPENGCLPDAWGQMMALKIPNSTSGTNLYPTHPGCAICDAIVTRLWCRHVPRSLSDYAGSEAKFGFVVKKDRNEHRL